MCVLQVMKHKALVVIRWTDVHNTPKIRHADLASCCTEGLIDSMQPTWDSGLGTSEAIQDYMSHGEKPP